MNNQRIVRMLSSKSERDITTNTTSELSSEAIFGISFACIIGFFILYVAAMYFFFPNYRDLMFMSMFAQPVVMVDGRGSRYKKGHGKGHRSVYRR